ncbi:MAG: hypothetical protein LBG75_01165 [Candidatus Nomurabacteria bacterium]|jgi:signal transduction histidine kinase|nr:hypothetical protein [Candidatus Nomurabacteria bacterium]
MPTRHQVSKPVAAIIALVVVVATIATAYLFYRNARYNIENVSIEAVSTIALTIEPSTVRALHGNYEKDKNNPVYKEQKALFKKITDVNDEFVFLYLMGVNKSHELFFYIDSDDGPEQALPGEIYDTPTTKMWKAIDTGASQFDDLYDGEDTDDWGTWISAYAPVKDENGKVIALLGIDIDQDKYLANIIIETSPPILIFLVFAGILLTYRHNTKKTLRQVEREKELLSVASHEVRSPLISIKWVLDDLLERTDGLPEGARKTLKAVDDNAAKVIASINGILSSTPTWGSGHKGNDDINMRELFQDIAETLALVAKEHKVWIHLGDSLTGDIVLKGDKQSLNHAFYNIVNNALKYAYPDTEVVIKYAKLDKYHQFRIIDHGPGVKPEDRDKIFQGLYRTEEAINSKQPGTGLGLYFVKRIIDDHGGKIYVDPDYTDGTAFVVELP